MIVVIGVFIHTDCDLFPVVKVIEHAGFLSSSLLVIVSFFLKLKTGIVSFFLNSIVGLKSRPNVANEQSNEQTVRIQYSFILKLLDIF
ncbi:hypothetical protein D3C85_1507090 [compost metagenome]